MATNSVSMNIKTLKALVRKAADHELGYKVCSAEDIMGPGGGVFIAANTELTHRHLAWIEQRNPARKTSPTFVEVVFTQHSTVPTIAAEFDEAVSEPPETKSERQRRATEISREVISRGEDVVHEANAIFQVIGDAPITLEILQGKALEEGLANLGWHLQLFHRIVAKALNEYLDGNTLIMDLITEYQGPHIVRHGLKVAVFAVEMCSHLLQEAEQESREGNGSGSTAYFELLEDFEEPERSDGGQEQPFAERFRRELTEIFLADLCTTAGCGTKQPQSRRATKRSAQN